MTVSERLITARSHSQQINISLTVAYAPTEDAADTNKDNFYQMLSDTINDQPLQDIKIVVGEFNARVTTDFQAWPGVIGKHSLHQDANDNGTRF